MNTVQLAIFSGANEQAGLWEVVSDISTQMSIGRVEALERLKGELDFIKSREDIYFVRSSALYSAQDCEAAPKEELLDLPVRFADFVDDGPFYYFSNMPQI